MLPWKIAFFPLFWPFLILQWFKVHKMCVYTRRQYLSSIWALEQTERLNIDHFTSLFVTATQISAIFLRWNCQIFIFFQNGRCSAKNGLSDPKFGMGDLKPNMRWATWRKFGFWPPKTLSEWFKAGGPYGPPPGASEAAQEAGARRVNTRHNP